MNYKSMDELKRLTVLREDIKKFPDIRIKLLPSTAIGIRYEFEYKDIKFEFYLDDVDKVAGMIYLITDQQNAWKQYA